MVLGCGRSGTSILGELFEHLTPYRYFSEPTFADVMEADYGAPLAFKVPREDHGFEAKPGLSFPITHMRRAAPEMKYFWIVRHPLDAICSLRIGISQDWGHHPRPPDWEEWLSRPLIERCAYHWAFLNTYGFGQVAQFATLIRFEYMIMDPGAIATSICASLGLEHADHQTALGAWAGRVQNTNNEAFDEAVTSRPYSRADHAVRVERWRENLTTDEVRDVLPIIGQTAERFGYSVSVA